MLGESAGVVYEPALELIAAIQISVKEMQLIAWLISKANRTNSICRHAIAGEERAWREWLTKRVRNEPIGDAARITCPTQRSLAAGLAS